MVRRFNFRLAVGHLLWPLLWAGSLQATVVVTVHPAARQRYAALAGDRESVLVTDGHAVWECRIDVPGVTTLFGSVATAGYRNNYGIPDTEDQQPGALRNVPYLDRPTSLAVWEHFILVLDAGHRAVRGFDLWNGILTSVTGPPPPPAGEAFRPPPRPRNSATDCPPTASWNPCRPASPSPNWAIPARCVSSPAWTRCSTPGSSWPPSTAWPP